MNNIHQILHDSQLKNTPARMAVLTFLDGENSPLSADDIYEHLRREHHEVDRATVYRILDVFVERGILRRLEFGEGKYRYELTGDDHHHLICERCGSIEDISDCSIGELELDIKRKKKFLVKRHALEFFGVCQTCQA